MSPQQKEQEDFVSMEIDDLDEDMELFDDDIAQGGTTQTDKRGTDKKQAGAKQGTKRGTKDRPKESVSDEPPAPSKRRKKTRSAIATAAPPVAVSINQAQNAAIPSAGNDNEAAANEKPRRIVRAPKPTKAASNSTTKKVDVTANDALVIVAATTTSALTSDPAMPLANGSRRTKPVEASKPIKAASKATSKAVVVAEQTSQLQSRNPSSAIASTKSTVVATAKATKARSTAGTKVTVPAKNSRATNKSKVAEKPKPVKVSRAIKPRIAAVPRKPRATKAAARALDLGRHQAAKSQARVNVNSFCRGFAFVFLTTFCGLAARERFDPQPAPMGPPTFEQFVVQMKDAMKNPKAGPEEDFMAGLDAKVQAKFPEFKAECKNKMWQTMKEQPNLSVDQTLNGYTACFMEKIFAEMEEANKKEECPVWPAGADPYTILNVSRKATVREVKNAHREISLLCHSDKNQHKKVQADVDQQRLNGARDTLLKNLGVKRYQKK